MGDTDLGLIMMLIISVSVFAVLGATFVNDSISNDAQGFKSESGILASLWTITTNFFGYLIFNDTINNPYITALIFIPISFMVLILSVRYIRGV